MGYVPKPASQKPYRAVYHGGGGWRVIGPDGHPLEGVFARQVQASAHAGSLNKRAAQAEKRKERACMRCQKNFQSEGIHNRMCDFCRRCGSEQLPVGFSFGAVNGRRKFG